MIFTQLMGLSGYDLYSTKGVQQALSDLGYDPGPIDGIMGPKTKSAIMAFQTDAGISIDGVVGPQTRDALSQALSPGGGASAAPQEVPPVVIELDAGPGPHPAVASSPLPSIFPASVITPAPAPAPAPMAPAPGAAAAGAPTKPLDKAIAFFKAKPLVAGAVGVGLVGVVLLLMSGGHKSTTTATP